MGDNTSSSKKSGYNPNFLDFLGLLAGAATLVATFSLGPIDFGRSVYNQIIGDTPVLKRHLTNYARKGIIRENPNLKKAGIELKLSNKLNAPIRSDGTVDPLQASIENLWDASEDYASSWYQRWVWPDLYK